MTVRQKWGSKTLDASFIGLPDSTACGSQTFAVGSVGGPKVSLSVVAGMSSKTSSQDNLGIKVPPHWISDGG